MKTIILERPGELRAADTAAPAELAPGWALVRVRRVGVCGTDWHAYHGRQPFFSYPRILGHELGVTVEAINDPRSDLKPGDRCAVEPYLNCGNCIACRNRKPNCCVNLKVIGVHVDGGMREQLAVPADKLHPSSRLSLDQLALVEPLGIGCHAVDRAGIQKGEWVLVLGAGPIGRSVVPFAAAAGARLIVADVAASRLAWCAQQPGVSHALNADHTDFASVISDLTDGELPTAVFDATGNAQSMSRSFELVAHGGRIVFVGLVQGEVTFNDPNFHRRELTLLGSRNARPEDFSRIICLMEQGRLDTTNWITHRAGYEELVNIFPRWAQPDAGVFKAIAEF
jgi:2-desacetyl-2-hydroxyethyl bacteriochlorophyllide A dehydrogenase